MCPVCGQPLQPGETVCAVLHDINGTPCPSGTRVHQDCGDNGSNFNCGCGLPINTFGDCDVLQDSA